MRAIDELDVIELQHAKTEAQVKNWIRILFWSWFESNKTHKIKLSLFKGLLRPTVSLKDLRPLFVILFGEP